jgi:chromosome segregation ATPase
MGLFNRRAETKKELDALRAEIQMVRSRLNESEEEKRRLTEHLGHLGSAQERLTTQIGTVEQQVGAVEHHVVTVAGSIGPAINSAVVQASSAADVELIRTEMARLGGLATHVEQLRETVAAHQLAVASNGDAATEEQAGLHARLEELAAALALQQEQIADVALVATDAAERTDTALDEVRAVTQADATPERDPVAELQAQLGQLAEKVGAVDSRVNQVSLELTNQLTELSGDLDRASTRADALDMIEQLTSQLNDVTGGQQRLANEQARYAIQFREDLAELADRLRRPGSA